MGMGVATGGSGGSRRRRRARPRAMSEINVTPFVDVMLVLLIIFMVAAPLLVVGVPIDLPETSANALESEEEPITVSVTADGRVFLQETEIELAQLLTTLEAIASEGVDTRIFVRGDRGTDYGTIMQVMARISGAGYQRLGLVTAEEEGS
ncbi:protein TolR [Ahrensia marina]|uniref:protein TolR n=1 Tax=Ahrensia marina TaxID=1514904 RepID=UPI0035CFE88E